MALAMGVALLVPGCSARYLRIMISVSLSPPLLLGLGASSCGAGMASAVSGTGFSRGMDGGAGIGPAGLIPGGLPSCVVRSSTLLASLWTSSLSLWMSVSM